MDLLTNAVESIQVGVEDYQSGTRPRLLSAVRNIHAGILLLYKEAVRRESPKGCNDVLLMAKISPSRDANGKVMFVGEGRKTVDAQQIRARFEALGLRTDWKRFDQVNTVRNDVEHLYPGLDQKGLHGLISNSFLIVRDFIAEQLHDDPRGLLGEETWALLADEVGLGKTIEAGLVLSQKWAERKRRVLVITPANLRKQWHQELTEKFFLPCQILETKSYNDAVKRGNFRPLEIPNAIVICSYQFARSKAADVANTAWDLTLILACGDCPLFQRQ